MPQSLLFLVSVQVIGQLPGLFNFLQFVDGGISEFLKWLHPLFRNPKRQVLLGRAVGDYSGDLWFHLRETSE